MNGLLLLAALAAAGTAGYTVGRTRPGPWLVDWAEDQITLRPARSPRYWAAVPLILIAAAAYWTLHPRRSAANVRAARAEHLTK